MTDREGGGGAVRQTSFNSAFGLKSHTKRKTGEISFRIEQSGAKHVQFVDRKIKTKTEVGLFGVQCRGNERGGLYSNDNSHMNL